MAKEITKDIVNFIANEVASGRVDERFSELMCILVQDYLDKHPVREIVLEKLSGIVVDLQIVKGSRCALYFLEKDKPTPFVLDLGPASKLKKVLDLADHCRKQIDKLNKSIEETFK